jgi:hypothetical protein
VLTLIAVISGLFLRFSSLSVGVEVFQTGYFLLLVFSPVLLSIPRLRLSTKLHASPWIQLFVSFLFWCLVTFLRTRMPADPHFALRQMYFGEDNAGIVEVLSMSLKSGYEGHVALFGEFINGAYLSAAGSILWFGEGDTFGLLAALTHYNMTLLFMAWVPLATLLAIALSGRKLSGSFYVLSVLFMSAILALLLWPFMALGHTAVISSALIMMPLLSITLNRDLGAKHPVLYVSIITALGFLAGSTWFPLWPFAAAVIALACIAVLGFQYRAGNRRIVIGLVILIVFLCAYMFPGVLEVAFSSGSYLEYGGGTRRPSRMLAIFWFTGVLLVIWILIRRRTEIGFLGSILFVATLSALASSVFYLLLSGLVANAGTFGYGATKYALTAIAFSMPVLWLVISDHYKTLGLRLIALGGVLVLVVILLTQGDSRRIVEATVLPNSPGYLQYPEPAQIEDANSGVVGALSEALNSKADHVFCVSDYGFPAPGEKVTLDSYFCTRWGQSFTSPDSSAWRFVPLDRQEEKDLEQVKKTLAGDKVVLIRLTRPGSDSTIKPSDTWWYKYTDKSWQIVSVEN